MEPSENALDLIKCFEGFKPVAYWCPGRVLTIGYGHTRKVRPGQRITHSEAVELLKEDAREAGRAVSRRVRVPLNQNQFDALVSWVYNLGEGALARSSLLRKLNSGDYDSVPFEMRRWRYSGGRILRGLVRRREAEGQLFAKPIDDE